MLRPNFFPEFDRNDNCDGDHGYVDDHPNPDADHNQLTDEQLRHRATWKDIWLQAKKYEAVSWLCLNCWDHWWKDFILISDLDNIANTPYFAPSQVIFAYIEEVWQNILDECNVIQDGWKCVCTYIMERLRLSQWGHLHVLILDNDGSLHSCPISWGNLQCLHKIKNFPFLPFVDWMEKCWEKLLK